MRPGTRHPIETETKARSASNVLIARIKFAATCLSTQLECLSACREELDAAIGRMARDIAELEAQELEEDRREEQIARLS